MKIYTLWATRKSDGVLSPELVTAWDEYALCENYEGWEANCAVALKAIGSDLAESRVIILNVDDISLKRAFEQPQLDATVI